jgi:hypothetical protein
MDNVQYNIHTVEYLLKARTLDPEKQLLVVNGSETTFISRQHLGKHVSAAMDTYATIEVLLETVFSTWSVQRTSVWESVKKRGSWKDTTIQRRLEHRN